MSRERVRNEKLPRTSEKITELKNKNTQKKAELETHIKNLEQEKQQLLKQRQEILSSVDQTNRPSDYKDLNNKLSNLQTQRSLLE